MESVSADLTVPEEEWAVDRASALPSLVARSRRAAERFAQRDPWQRGRALRDLGHALLARGDDLVRAIVEDTSKPEAEALLHEVLSIAELARFWAEEGPTMLTPSSPRIDPIAFPGKRAVIERRPRGVVGLITPANYPLAIPLRTIFPALLGGNAVVLKPSERAPEVARLVADIVRATLGAGLVTVVEGGPDVVRQLLWSKIDAAVFVGGVEPGREVGRIAAQALVPVSLELGGKDVAVVLEDAHVERAARGLVWAAISNAGQNCAAVERVVVVRKVADKLRRRAAAIAAELRPGIDFGPLVSERQLAIVKAHVDRAIELGAKVMVGGQRIDRDGHWFAPTVIDCASGVGPILLEETFGPVLPIVEVAGEDEAIALANETRFALTASVWTKRLRTASRVAAQLTTGVVTVNDHAFSASIPALPWGGPGETGSGVTGSADALAFLTHPRATVIDMRGAKAELHWYPYDRALVRMGRALVTLKRPGPLHRKLAAILSLAWGGFLRALPSRRKR